MRARVWSVLPGVVVAGGVAVGCCAPALLSASITPSGSYDEARVPPAPDYAQDRAWLALPSTKDEADVALAALPAATSPAVDVFYLHPTSSIARAWSSPADDPAIRTASIRGGTLIQASAFNAVGGVYAPTYRQSTGTAYVELTEAGQRAIDVAFGDVVRAWQSFRARAGSDRPFILAAHSQGSFLGARLLRETIVSDADRARLVAAYLIGAPLTPTDLGGLGACARADEVGCIVTYNARAPEHETSVGEFGAPVPWPARLCVNPVLGVTSSAHVDKARHGGAVFFDADSPALLPQFAASECKDGRLVVTKLDAIPSRGAMSAILLWTLGGTNYHPIEFQLFYADLRADAVRRAAAFMSEDPVSRASRVEAHRRR